MSERSEALVFVEYSDHDGQTVALFRLEGAARPLMYTRRALENRLAALVAADNPHDTTKAVLARWPGR